MKLVNVRLNAEDAKLVADLRERGVSISDVVRRALRTEARDTSAKAVNTAKVLEELFVRYPTPPGVRRTEPAPARDSRAARRIIRSRLRRPR